MPECLPWARPLSPSFGGGSNNPGAEDGLMMNNEVGWCSVPHAGNATTGSQVFVFFENGDINYPIYFGVAQSGDGWFSEHPNQHCFRSDNVRIRVDENVYDKRSTTKFDSYNSKNSEVSKKNLERDCKKHGWKFDANSGNISQLETRIDIEIEASEINAVNLNIHGNVNMHVDGNIFTEHIGNRYDYHKGDHYVKHDGNTYIEENGHYRKVSKGNITLERNGNIVENQEGDILTTRTGTMYEQIDNDVVRTYNGNQKIKVSGNDSKIIGGSSSVDIAKDAIMNIGGDTDVTLGGHMMVISNSFVTINSHENIEIKTKEGNIYLKTEGEFELIKNGQITTEGFRNLGTKGNIHFISTFGNINMQCIKNDALANFAKKTTVVPWNPDFIRIIKEKNNQILYPDFNPSEATVKGTNFSTDVDGIAGFSTLMQEVDAQMIYDGLPVFLPTRMIIQNPNPVHPDSENDYSWILSYRDEPDDWRSIKDGVMWKLPGRLMRKHQH